MLIIGNYTIGSGISQGKRLIIFVFYFVDDIDFMPDMPASILKQIPAKGHHVVIFDELIDLILCDFHA